LFRLLADGKFIAVLARGEVELAPRLERLGIVVARLGADASARRFYGTSHRDLWLIRPDGYVVLRCASSDRARQRAVLEKLWSAEAVSAALGLGHDRAAWDLANDRVGG
jgi:hypothetical protein